MTKAVQKSVFRLNLVLLLAVAPVALVGCSSDADQSDAPMQEPADAAAMEPPAPAAGERVEPVPPAPGPQDADEIFEQERRARTLEAQKKDILVDEYLLQADRYIAKNDLERAERALLQALELEPSNERAIRRFHEVQAMQGEPVADLQALADVMVAKRKLIRKQRKARVQDKYVKANQHYQNGEFEKARVELEEAATIMRFDAFQTEFGRLAEEVPAMLEVVEGRLAHAKRAEEEEQFREAYSKLLEEENRRRRKQRDEVQRMMIRAIESFQNQDFENAEFLARRVLKKFPNYLKAKELLDVSRQARRSAWREAYYRMRAERYQTWLEEMRETQIPYNDLIIWPDADTWSDLTRMRRAQAAATVQAEESDAVRAIKAKLANERVDVDWGGLEEDVTLSQALRELRSRMGINIVMDPEVAAEKGEEPVRLSLVNHNLGSVIRTMLENQDLAYTFRHDVLYVTTRERALGSPVPNVYEVRDLTIQLPNFKAPNLNLRPGGTGEAAKAAIWGEDLEKTQDTSIDQLLDLIRQNVAPLTWDSEGFRLESSVGGQIVAVTTPEIHLRLQQFLNDLRRFTKLTVHVEARFISIDKATIDEAGVDFRGLGGSNPGTVALLDDITNGAPNRASAGLDNGQPGLPAAASLSPSAGAFFNDNSDGDVRARTEHIFDRTLGTLLSGRGGATLAFTLLDDLQVTALLRAVEKKIDATMVTAPRLTIYNNQRANLTLVNQVSYVKDYDVEVAQTAFIADPLIDVVQDGLTLDVRPTVSHDRKYVTLEVQPTVATLMRPIRTFETNLSGLTTPVVIELPELEVKSAATTVKVPDNGYLVIGGFKHISTVDRRSETPILSNIPILSFFFSKKGRSDELRDLLIVLNVRIVDLAEQESQLVN